MIYILANIIAITGMIFICTSLVGLYRFKSLGSQIHAASISDSFGLPLCIFALSMIQESWEATIKLWMAIALIMLLSPLSSHALINAAWKNEEELKK